MILRRLRPKAYGRVLAYGERLTLREFSRADVDQWLSWPPHTDPLYQSFNPPPMSLRQRDLYFVRERRANDVRQFAAHTTDGQLVGRLRLREIDWFARTAVLGVSFRADRLGIGLGTEGLRLLLDHYFDRMAMTALFLDVAAHNERARRCYERCGFRALGEQWGEAMPDLAGIFRNPDYAAIRHLFKFEHGLVRPLLIDMAIHRSDRRR